MTLPIQARQLWLPRPYACPSSTYALRRKPAFLPMAIKLTCLSDLYHILKNHSQSRLLVLQLLSSGWKQRKSEFNTTQDFLLITVLNSHL